VHLCGGRAAASGGEAGAEAAGEGGVDDIKLSRKLEALATRESSLDSREAALEAGQKALEDARLMVTARVLADIVRETDLDTRATELTEKDKWLAKRQMQELTAT
jgi:hypothetical protein